MKTIHNYIECIIKANPSKSYMQRAIALAFLSETPTRIFSPSLANDSLTALKLIEQLDCKIEYFDDCIQITPTAEHNSKENLSLHCGESGLLMRMFAPILSLFSGEYELLASGSLKNRELFEIENVLESFGAEIETNGNYPPIKIKGPIRPGKIKLKADKTSQFLTGLLISLPKLSETSIIEVENLVSAPYIDITLDLIEKFGGKVLKKDAKTFEIYPSSYFGRDIEIEGDWSSAALFLIAGAIAGEVTVTGLNLDSKQGDKAILNVLEQVGTNIEYHSERSDESRLSAVIPAKAGIQKREYMDSSVALIPQNDILNSVTVKKNKLHSFLYDATNTPDLVPYLAILAANCEGKSMIHNVRRLNLKESRRLDLILKNMSLLGIKTELNNDTLSIRGGEILGGNFETRNDHRMAMAGALASLTSENKIIIDNPNCVKKSYPKFWEVFEKLYKIN